MKPKLEDIASMVAQQLGRRRVAADDRLVEDLGAESIDVVNIIAAVEQRYGIAIAESALLDLRRVEDLFALAHRSCAGDRED